VIVWENGAIIKLSECALEEVMPDIAPILLREERVAATFKAFRDYVVFTSKRIIAVNARGITGQRRDITTLPWGGMDFFTITTQGGLDHDASLSVSYDTVDLITFEFKGHVDMGSLAYLLADFLWG
jgi:hypothetical protein